MPHLICYDISDNGLRAKMGRKIVESGLDRINKSVYLGAISDSGLAALEAELSALVQGRGDPNDSLILISVGASQVHGMRVYGRNDLDPGELTGEKSTLMM